ncbi:phosphotransferase family protein [Westerdykella ornata]|uniref:Phosphotransferase family protein n=1 Tax=Westerdykella ornata TaxID=318751 RepID=A0A6A6JK57_WESOR|nr:phosphotransferase family protein [Westerdykella ornata]KAF2276615.1 phosphotransferase family protein [Westerdykella ornata]
MEPRMKFDDAAWERSDEIFDAWKKKLYHEPTQRAIADLIKKHRGGVPKELFAPQRGAFNVTYRLQFADGGSAIIRFPCPGIHMFPEEKVRNEVAIMRYISDHTTIPVPFVLHHGTAEECPGNLGPFIIMEYIDGAQTLCSALNVPYFTPQDRPILDPEVSEEKLIFVYEQLADILLQLSTLTFDKIGTPLEVEEEKWAITERPLTFDMNEMIQLANCPRSELISTTFATSTAYFSAIADMKIMHLTYQPNDAIESPDDCRRKYIGRHLFKKLAIEKSLHDPRFEKGPFRLWCDDLRPENILVDENCRVLAVIDWEFTYAAPAEFTFNPPWWLLLEAPEYWIRGFEDWCRVYEPRMKTFIRVMSERENAFIEKGRMKEEERLSVRMMESWTSGRFWIDYAVRRSWAFDAVFWTFVDREVFGGDGTGEGYMERLGLLDKEVREGLEAFVERKVEESKTRVLREWV